MKKNLKNTETQVINPSVNGKCDIKMQKKFLKRVNNY